MVRAGGAFPFDSTLLGIVFIAAVSFLTARASSALDRRGARNDDARTRRRDVAKDLRAATYAIERALDDPSSVRQTALDVAFARFRDVAYIDLGGEGSEALQDRATEFVNGLEALEIQHGPLGPHDEAVRTLLDDMTSAIHAFGCGWRVPGRLGGHPGVLGLRPRHPAKAVPEHLVPDEGEVPG